MYSNAWCHLPDDQNTYKNSILVVPLKSRAESHHFSQPPLL